VPSPIKVRKKAKSPRAFTPEEKERIALILNEERFVDRSPLAIHAALLQEGAYICSPRSMYRELSERGELKERRRQRKHPNYTKPELMARKPNQVWTWDITDLKGPQKGVRYKLYVIIDIFSRFVVGWRIEHVEKDTLAEELIAKSCTRQTINRDQLTIHSDRGSSMTSTKVKDLLCDLGVERSFNRPHVSNDNPFIEAHFKHVKYHSEYPARFGSAEDARVYFRWFFDWYNKEHFHSGLNMFTPATVHGDQVLQCAKERQVALDAAFAAHPERFVKGCPKVKLPPAAAWINPPTKEKGVFLDTTSSAFVVGKCLVI
jgi:putative transposase